MPAVPPGGQAAAASELSFFGVPCHLWHRTKRKAGAREDHRTKGAPGERAELMHIRLPTPTALKNGVGSLGTPPR